MNKLKFLVSLLLALGLVACPDDEDEKAEDYSLKVGSISNVEKGGKFSVPVEVQKDSKIVTEGDGATLKVTVAINCVAKETTDKEVRNEVKPTAKAAVKGKVTVEGDADASWDVEDTCTAKATADGAKEASGTFKITAASSDDDDDTASTKTPKFVPVDPKRGQQFSISDGSGKINLVGSNGTDPCTGSKLYLLKGETLAEVNLTNGHTLASGDAFFVIGGQCKVKVDGITAPQALADKGANEGVAITVGTTDSDDHIKVTFTAVADAARRSNPLLFVSSGATWVKVDPIASPGWVAATDEWASEVDESDTATENQALLRANGFWTHDAGGS